MHRTHTLDGRLFGKTHNWSWETNLQIIHLNLVNFCNLKCPNCQSFCGLAPDSTAIPVDYVSKFVRDAIRLKHRFVKVKLYGGEPILHPQIDKIVEILSQYRNHYLEASQMSPFKERPIQFICDTNGTPESMRLIQKHLPEWFALKNANSVARKVWTMYTSINVAPIDVPAYKDEDVLFREGCCMTTVCGSVTLQCNGRYYPCAVSGHIDRVFNLQTGAPDLETFLKRGEKFYRDIFQKTCRYCGFFKYPREVVTEQTTSPTWEKAFKEYAARRKLKLM